MSDVTIIGLGTMGVTLARLLLRSGRSVAVWNRTRAKAEPLLRDGVEFASSAAAAIAASPVTIICVYDHRATREILEGEGVASALAGRTLIQLTTNSPREARETEVWANEHGGAYLDGAIQAAPAQMGRPDTTILLSGAEAAFGGVEPILKVLAGNIAYLGARIDAAATMDLATLSYVYGATLGFFHGARISEAEGFAVDTYGALVSDIAPAFGQFLKHEGAVIHSGNFAVSESPLRISVEATERIAAAARDARINTEFPDFVAGLFRRAAKAGYGDEEVAALIKVLRA